MLTRIMLTRIMLSNSNVVVGRAENSTEP